jgi:DNA polymerase type B, organellar and viral
LYNIILKYVILLTTFTYIVKDGIASDDRRLLHAATYKVNKHNFNNIPLPLSMNPNDYGEIRGTFNIKGGVRYFIKNNNTSFEIDVCGNINTVTINSGRSLKWIDTVINENTFERVINKNTLYIQDGAIIVKTKQLNAKPFSNVKLDSKLSTAINIMTIDIETVNVEGKLKPYLICGYNPKPNSSIVSFAESITDEGIDTMFSDFINTLLSLKHITTVYAHNLSSFDGVLLLKYLITYKTLNAGQSVKVEPLIHNGKIISITLRILEEYINEKGKTSNKIIRSISFNDSLLLLPMSLRKLCKSFSIPLAKGFFPVLFNDIHYVGPIPHYSYWTDITYDEWQEFAQQYGDRWSFKEEAIKYCILDCYSLFQVLIKFNELVFGEFKINVFSSLTLPALAMKIYKALYMPKDSIYQVQGLIDEDIREAYSGGAVDVFIPHNIDMSTESSKILYYYDVNSLYPTIMANMKLPVGKPTTFTGDIRSVDPNVHGFFYCDITSPVYMEHPILQRRIKTSNGIRTIAGLGSWTGWISSVEMDIAIKNGYKIQILSGYLFEHKLIFKEYIEKMYDLRMKYPKSDPMNLIAKLLMNSLYGKFGMKPEKTVVDIFDQSNSIEKIKFDNIIEVWGEHISDHINLGHHSIIVRKNISNYKYDDEEDMYHGSDINVAIAASITAGARMYMTTFKNNPNFNLYYSDTDSIVIDRPLSEKLLDDKTFSHELCEKIMHQPIIGDGLGQLKLEHEVGRGVFLAPKVYALETLDGSTVIKIKGLSNKALSGLKYNDLSKLLKHNSSLEFTQEKWIKEIIKGNIQIDNVLYNLKVTANKRAPIYEFGIYSNTRPYNYNDIIK